ncbi:hypothetical protein Corgl_1405 [Coriobacterium glomerans PW2]|uniref:DUF4352 domain-containing protein n=1 Tax=Coriobacterium glomerans (strain ATCC 49209 / DSM 20642 / JCM 10262 / PW2) TaxID=700015 RepID=F2NAQ0_CORGP|nr:DUF4352 domain-containing protein [Coriobacterium glomerans]AEB07506.1 hypothetical protein Corgl_1405 [Coriobacterium glomerans PW2]
MVDNAQGRSHSAAAIVGIVLGVLALVLSWVPIINNFAAPLAVIGAIFAIVGIVGTVRGKRSGKGLAIAAVIVNVIAFAIVMGTQAMYVAAIDHAANGPSATSKSQDKDSSDKGSSKGDYKDLSAGTEVKLENGLSVKLDSVQGDLKNYDGSKVIGIHVTYVNNGDKEVSYNSFDWKGEDAKGAQETATYYSEGTDELNSGTLAAGGTVSGNIYFKDGTVKALYTSSFLSKSETASWKLS